MRQSDTAIPTLSAAGYNKDTILCLRMLQMKVFVWFLPAMMEQIEIFLQYDSDRHEKKKKNFTQTCQTASYNSEKKKVEIKSCYNR